MIAALEEVNSELGGRIDQVEQKLGEKIDRVEAKLDTHMRQPAHA